MGVVFFLWVGIFNSMIVAQFWSFANDIYTKEQGERLFAIVAFGGSLGAVLASVVAGKLIPLIGVPQLLLAAAGLLILASGAQQRGRRPGTGPARNPSAGAPHHRGDPGSNR